MSGRSMIERLRWRVLPANDSEFGRELGLSLYMLRKFTRGIVDQNGDVTLTLLKQISDASETPIGMLVEWFFEPEEAGLAAAAESAALGFA